MKYLYFILFILITACNSKEDKATEIVKQWIGRELTIPYDMFTIGGESIPIDPAEYDYKIINYVNPIHCTRCQMKLELWNKYISEFDTTDVAVGLYTLISTNDINGINEITMTSSFNYPIMIDSLNIFAYKNNPPSDIRLNTFLLDSDDHILAIGNPVLTPAIGNLYRTIILGDSICDAISSVEIDMPSRNLGITHSGDSITTKFYLTNNTDITLSIDTIISSCDCTTARMRQARIEPGTIATLETIFTSDSIKGPFQRQVYVYFNELETPSSVQLTGINKPTI